MKVCTKCKKEKSLEAFTNRSLSSDGKFPWCRECKNNHYRAGKKKRGLTPVGKAMRAWENINNRIGKQGYEHVEVKMTKKEFLEWAIPVYEKFMEKHPCDVPSVDRKDSEGHYQLNNIQIISLSDNSRKSLPVRFMKCMNPSLKNKMFLKEMSEILVVLCRRRGIKIGDLATEVLNNEHA